MFLQPKKKQEHVNLFEEDSFGDFQEGIEDLDDQPHSKVIRKKKKGFQIDPLKKKKHEMGAEEVIINISDDKNDYPVNFFGDRL